MPRRTLKHAGFALAALVAAALPGARGAAAETPTLHVYSARHYDLDRELYDGFTKKTGVAVKVIEGEFDALVQRITAEGEAGPGDLLVAVDSARLTRAADAGLFRKLEAPALTGLVPAHLRDEQDRWIALSTRARIIFYAKDRVDPKRVARYEDLADPRWKGRVLTRSSSSPYSISLVASVLAADGPETTSAWIKGLVGNLARDPKGGDTAQLMDLAAGQGDLTVANTYYFGKLLTSKKPEEREAAAKIGAIFPNQGDRGAHVNVSGIGVLAASKHHALATKLVEFLLSPEAQRRFADANMEYPANPNVPPHPELGKLGAFKADPVAPARLAGLAPQALRLMERDGWR